MGAYYVSLRGEGDGRSRETVKDSGQPFDYAQDKQADCSWRVAPMGH